MVILHDRKDENMQKSDFVKSDGDIDYIAYSSYLENRWNRLKNNLLEYGIRSKGVSLSGREYNIAKEIEVEKVLLMIQEIESDKNEIN